MNRTTPINKTPLRTSPRFRTAGTAAASSSSPTTAVVSPRKRTISATPPFSRRSTEKTKRLSESTTGSSSTSSDKPAAAKLKRKDNALYYLNLDVISYYDLLNVPRNASKADITSKVNNLQLVYKKSRPLNTDKENSNEKIHSTLGNALQVLSVIPNRRVYDQYMKEKDNVTAYFNDNIVPLRKTANEIYSGALRLQNDVKEFNEMNIAEILIPNVNAIIERNIKNIHYKTTLTNRLLIEWPVPADSYNNGGIDEDYIQKYFKDDGLVAVMMCSTRPGCAVIELITQKNIKSIIEREQQRKIFSSVRDFTEAEFGIDQTNYEPQLDKVKMVLNDIQELEHKLDKDHEYLDTIRIDTSDLEAAERQLNFTSAFLKMESSGDELDADDDDEDEEMYEVNE
ncbi:BJDP [Spodoptera eridania nucleopolyhedrovirus]|uniref:BJDP n=1 Tax=Spodoptera eridania nucleopolyhedrovirus TaxID=2315721 RepID=A0A346TQ49_9ABAC|nr:BJDP [Spodoptera eridania nucleopolyhedrovirus]AXU41709.1 BJDP [Spodoptera eridania nucleopolyhedrovirus]